MKKENRLLKDDFSGDNMDSSLNFVPKMNREALLTGYRSVLNTIYSPKHYYERIKVLLREYKPKSKPGLSQIHFHHLMGFIKPCGSASVGERRTTLAYFAPSCYRPRLFPC
jgi:hypothetical protein